MNFKPDKALYKSVRLIKINKKLKVYFCAALSSTCCLGAGGSALLRMCCVFNLLWCRMSFLLKKKIYIILNLH